MAYISCFFFFFFFFFSSFFYFLSSYNVLLCCVVLLCSLLFVVQCVFHFWIGDSALSYGGTHWHVDAGSICAAAARLSPPKGVVHQTECQTNKQYQHPVFLFATAQNDFWTLMDTNYDRTAVCLSSAGSELDPCFCLVLFYLPPFWVNRATVY